MVGANGTGTTLQAGDALIGGLGTDVLNISVSGAAANATTTTAVNAVTLTGIEKVAVNNFNTQTMTGGNNSVTIDASLFDSALATLALSASSSTANQGDTAFTNVKQIVAAEMSQGVGNLTIGYVGTAVAGSADAMGLTLTNQTGGTFTADGIEILNVTSNVASNTVTLAGAQLKTVNVTGSANANLGTLAGTVTKVDASAFKGNLTATAGFAVDYNIAGGDGNDSVSIAVANLTAADTITGGNGTDTLTVDAAFTAANAANVTGFEVLASNANVTVDASILSGVTALRAGSTAAANALTFTNVGAAVTDIFVTGTEGVVATLKTDTSADAIKVTYGTAATATAAGTGVTVDAAAGQTTLNNYETMTIVSQGAANNTGAFSATSLKSLTITGDKALTLGSMNAGNTAISSIDASALTSSSAAFIMTDNNSATASTITGG